MKIYGAHKSLVKSNYKAYMLIKHNCNLYQSLWWSGHACKLNINIPWHIQALSLSLSHFPCSNTTYLPTCKHTFIMCFMRFFNKISTKNNNITNHNRNAKKHNKTTHIYVNHYARENKQNMKIPHCMCRRRPSSLSAPYANII